jgi:hypothetical protein
MNTNNNTRLYNENMLPPPQETNKSSFMTNLTGVIMVIGFLVVIGITILKSFSQRQVNKEIILFRQGELLDILKTSTNELETQKAVHEYDSLTHILELLENK